MQSLYFTGSSILFASFYISGNVLILTAVDRYISIKHPFFAQKWLTTRTVCTLIAVVYFTGVENVFNCPIFNNFVARFYFFLNHNNCVISFILYFIFCISKQLLSCYYLRKTYLFYAHKHKIILEKIFFLRIVCIHVYFRLVVHIKNKLNFNHIKL